MSNDKRPRLDDPVEFALIKKMYFTDPIIEVGDEEEYYDRMNRRHKQINQSQ